MKCPICNLTLADPPNGEGESVPVPGCVTAGAPRGAGVPAHTDTPAGSTRTPYRAEVIDNAVLALSGGIKL
jgi:hypothetical protein